MKAKHRIRKRNLLCVLSGMVVMVSGMNTGVVQAVTSSTVDTTLSAGAGTALEVNLDEIETEATTTESSTETTTEETTESIEPEKLQAGAAVLLDADLSLNQDELKELVKNNTVEDTQTEETEVATEETEETEEESGLVMAKVNEYVNVRVSADQDADKVGVLYKDCGGELVEQKDGWSKISSGDVEGWVKDEFLYFGEEAEDIAKEVGMLTATTTTQTLRVRKEPSQSAGIYGLLAYDESVEAISEEGEWVAINFEGSTGYVSAEYVDIDFDIDVAESMEAILSRERQAAEEKAKRTATKDAVMANASEVDILAALIQCEAGGEPYEGQVAVGAVVMNRVRSGGYPNSITDVIYASGQFSPASSGKMDNLILNGNIKQSCRQAAQEVINGNCNIGDAMHFRRSGTKEGYIIGNHVFW